MNIQLRDSKTLQDEIIKNYPAPAGQPRRNALPKAQLHPELLEAYVDTDSGGFVVRSTNPNDINHLEWFLPQSDTCRSAWVFSGRGETRIAHELVFTFASGGKLALRTQSAADVTKLTSVVPSDQSHEFTVKRDGGKLTLTRAGSEKPSAISSLSNEELQVQAAINGVEWDKKASRETMIQRIAVAITKKKPEKQPA